jgi:hypothetical protein
MLIVATIELSHTPPTEDINASLSRKRIFTLGAEVPPEPAPTEHENSGDSPELFKIIIPAFKVPVVALFGK